MIKEEWDFQRLQFSVTLSFPSLCFLSALSPELQVKLLMEASFYSQQQKPLQRMTYGGWDAGPSGDTKGDSVDVDI